MFELIKKHAIKLALFAALTTAMTAFVYHLTKDKIIAQTYQERLALLSQVLPSEFQSTALLNQCVMIENSELGNIPKPVYQVLVDGKRVAAVTEVTAPDGYSGDILILVAAQQDGTILGVRTLSHKETPGLGDKIDLDISDWILQFAGFKLHAENEKTFAVKKDGGTIDQFAGATITPRAVVNAIKRAVAVIQNLDDDLSMLPKCNY
ncbi:electron transport complex subunit RsxG [Thorsellia kenyensis]|uniref:Ion-translocating oxidoreductase complex subunit G n=1 Tax=Thorsellia kenyensis TaxID=1549888 RepID=A0ABV6C8L5_9GAMM